MCPIRYSGVLLLPGAGRVRYLPYGTYSDPMEESVFCQEGFCRSGGPGSPRVMSELIITIAGTVVGRR